jgi:ribosomal protein L13
MFQIVYPKLTIKRAVKRMLSQTETKRLMRRLKIYNDQTHLHKAQNPIQIDVNNLYKSIEIKS